MGFSPLANTSRRIPDVGRSDPRNSSVTGVGIHHNASVNAFGMATSPGRVVSANYWITNDGVILPNIDENRRAWTSGAAGYPAGASADHRNITIEVSNSPEGVRTGSWAISNAAKNALIRLIADIYKRYNLGVVKRGASRGVGVHSDWVPTVCPGPYIMKHLPSIISEAEKIRSGSAKGKPEVKAYHRKDLYSEKGRGRTLTPGDHIYLNEVNGRAASATNIVGGIGQYSITPHVYAIGTPGDALDLTLFWKDTRKKNSRLSGHYVERLTFDKYGKINATREFKRAVSRGYAVYLRVRNPSENKNNCSIRLLRSDAFLFTS